MFIELQIQINNIASMAPWWCGEWRCSMCALFVYCMNCGRCAAHTPCSGLSTNLSKLKHQSFIMATSVKHAVQLYITLPFMLSFVVPSVAKLFLHGLLHQEGQLKHMWNDLVSFQARLQANKIEVYICIFYWNTVHPGKRNIVDSSGRKPCVQQDRVDNEWISARTNSIFSLGPDFCTQFWHTNSIYLGRKNQGKGILVLMGK